MRFVFSQIDLLQKARRVRHTARCYVDTRSHQQPGRGHPEFREMVILRALEETKGNVVEAAALLVRAPNYLQNYAAGS